MNCPRCKKNIFKTEAYEGVKIDRCQSCQGIWLDSGEIVKIINEREEIFESDLVTQTLEGKTSGVPTNEQEKKLDCPKCNGHMQSLNYAGDSGVIIDRCKGDHGIWFDKDELEKVQTYREHWEIESQRLGSKWASLAENMPKNGQEPHSGATLLTPFKLMINLFFKG